MKQEVIQDFLNLPGIAGVALIERRSRPYFYGVDQALNVQQKEALAQGILQVIETVPEGFKSFKFQFSGYQVHLHRLEYSVVLLVLGRDGFVNSGYLKTIITLQGVLRDRITDSLPGVGRALGDTSQPTGSRPRAETKSEVKRETKPEAIAGLTTNSGRSTPEPTPITTTTLQELLEAINHLSLFTTQYLGNQVVANYWKSTRPDQEWLSHFSIDRTAKFSLDSSSLQPLRQPITVQQQRCIQEWVAAYIKRCTQVIRNFPTTVEQKALTDAQKTILLG